MKSIHYFFRIIIILLIPVCITAQTKAPTIDFKKAFADKSLTKVEIGTCDFPTGNLIVGDPFFIGDLMPFTKTFSPGKYPVEILVHKVEEDYYVIAYAILKIKPEKAVKWELAITTDITEEQMKKLAKDGFFGFNSDSQLAAFFDTSTYEKYMKKKSAFYKKKPNGNYYTDVLEKEFKDYSGSNKFSIDVGDWNFHKLDKTSVVPMVSTAGRKGKYPVYWGLNKSGEIVECVMDFFVIKV